MKKKIVPKQTNTNIFHLFWQYAKIIQWRKYSLSKNSAEIIRYLYAKELNTELTFYIKFNLKMDDRFNCKNVNYKTYWWKSRKKSMWPCNGILLNYKKKWALKLYDYPD